MIRVLKIQQTPILNFRDLQKRFWPAEIFRQMELFVEFASGSLPPHQNSAGGQRKWKKIPGGVFYQGFLDGDSSPEPVAGRGKSYGLFHRGGKGGIGHSGKR